MVADKQDANLVGLFIAREESVGVLPANPIFKEREPNSFDDFGGDFKSIARRPFSPSRQRKKGGTVDLDTDGGFNEDFTQRGMDETMEAFFFAAMRRKPFVAATAAVAATDDFTVTSSANFVVGTLILASGTKRNNGLHYVNAITDGTHISTTSALVDEAGLTAAKIEAVGHRFAVGDISIAVVGGQAILTSATMDFRTYGLIPGEWVFVGGDNAANHFANNLGFYARIAEVNEDDIRFDKTTRTIADSDGAGKLIDLYFGYLVKNEDDPDLIVKFTHTTERYIGRDDDGIQSEAIDGFVFNEMKWTSPLADKVSIDIKGVGLHYNLRTGAEAPLSKDVDASIVRAEGDDLFNTSSNVFRLRLSIIEPGTLNPTPLFARVTEWSMNIKNNVTPNKAQGTLGAFDTTVGQFEVDGDFTAYFSTVAAIESIRDNADVTFDAIYSKKNAAVIMDIPLLGTGGGRLNVEMDAAIMIPLKIMAGESEFGHTALMNWLPYVPNVGMSNGA